VEIEFPKDSGRVAEYTEEETALVRLMMAEADAAGIEKSKIAHELCVLHEVKVCFDARLLSDEERTEIVGEPAFTSPPDSPFQIPLSAR
jgi:hypothetical protein